MNLKQGTAILFLVFKFIRQPLEDLREAGLFAAEPVREDTDKGIKAVRMETLVLDPQWIVKLGTRSEWSPWSECSVQYGGGERYRTRSCHMIDCFPLESEQCNTEACNPLPQVRGRFGF